MQLFGPMPSSVIMQGEIEGRRGSDRQEHLDHQQQRQQQLQAMQTQPRGGGGGEMGFGMMDGGMEGMDGMGMWDQMQGMDGFSYEDIFGNEDDWKEPL